MELIDKQLATSVWGQAVNEHKSPQQAAGAVSADGVSMSPSFIRSSPYFFRIFKKKKKKNHFVLSLLFARAALPVHWLLSASSSTHT
jgi:hypothetical protein